MNERDYIVSKAFREIEKAFNPARMKELEEQAFQRAVASRAAARKPGFKPHPQSAQGKSIAHQQMLTRTTGVSEQRRWGGTR